MRGSFVEVVPSSRVVFTWGWETLGDGLQPGASTVAFDLVRDGAGTRLKMVHSGLSADEAREHGADWDNFLPILGAVAAGGPAADIPALTRGEIFASKLHGLLVQAREFVDGCSDASWRAPGIGGDSLPVGVISGHLASHLGLAEFVSAVANGQPHPLAEVTAEGIEAMNAEAAAAMTGLTPKDVVATLRADGPKAVDALRSLTDEQLRRKRSMAFAGGAELTVGQVILGPLLANIEEHLETARKSA